MSAGEPAVRGALAAPEPTNAESEATAWVGVEDLDGLRLHPGLAASWPHLAPRLTARLTVVVDVANVMGSVNDGWYRDRLGAARRLRDRLAPLAGSGIAGKAIGWPEFDGFFPRLVLVVEGQAKPLAAEYTKAGVPGRSSDAIRVVAAPDDGDGQIVEEAKRAIVRGDVVVVATADRELRGRVGEAGAAAIGPKALNACLGT
jgi:hypothetical protein